MTWIVAATAIYSAYHQQIAAWRILWMSGLWGLGVGSITLVTGLCLEYGPVWKRLKHFREDSPEVLRLVIDYLEDPVIAYEKATLASIKGQEDTIVAEISALEAMVARLTSRLGPRGDLNPDSPETVLTNTRLDEAKATLAQLPLTLPQLNEMKRLCREKTQPLKKQVAVLRQCLGDKEQIQTIRRGREIAASAEAEVAAIRQMVAGLGTKADQAIADLQEVSKGVVAIQAACAVVGYHDSGGTIPMRQAAR